MSQNTECIKDSLLHTYVYSLYCIHTCKIHVYIYIIYIYIYIYIYIFMFSPTCMLLQDYPLVHKYENKDSITITTHNVLMIAVQHCCHIMADDK